MILQRTVLFFAKRKAKNLIRQVLQLATWKARLQKLAWKYPEGRKIPQQQKSRTKKLPNWDGAEFDSVDKEGSAEGGNMSSAHSACCCQEK